nr:juvenile hormone acid O-methyltransferase-like [Onthophagus taurus]
MFNTSLYGKYNSPFYSTAKEVLSKYGHLVNWPNKQRNLSEVMNILDAGCGEGTATVTFFQEFVKKNVENYRIFGVDFSEYMILKAKEKYNDQKSCEFELMDLSLEHFPDKYRNKFDLIYSTYCIHWINTTFWIQNFYKMLKPAGQIYLIAVTKNSVIQTFKTVNQREKFSKYQDTTAFDNHFFTKINLDEWLNVLLVEAGYKNINIQQIEAKARFMNKEVFTIYIKNFDCCYNHIPTNLVDDYANEVIEELIQESSKLYPSSSEIIHLVPIILISAEK